MACALRDLTRHKIGDRWRDRASLLVECKSHRKLERGAASGSLHRLVRPHCGSSLHMLNVSVAKNKNDATHRTHILIRIARTYAGGAPD
jgi:hypothetical protein